MAKRQDNQNKKISLIQWLFLIIIPLILAISIAFIILSILDLNPGAKVKELANQMPVINQIVTTEEEAAIERKENQLQNQITALKSDKSGLEADLSAQEVELNQLNQEIERLSHLLEQSLNDNESQVELESQDGLKIVIDTYQKMSAKSAAQILTNMKNADAIRILAELDEELRAAILSALDPESAANFTEQLLN